MTPAENSLLVELLKRCARKDERAAAELYRLSAPKLFAVVTRILRRDDWAEEALQETYLSIWRHADSYRTERSAPLTWMTSIARNRALDWLRRSQEDSLGENYQPMVERLTDDTPDMIQRLANAAETAALARCLDALDANSRQAIALAYYHGLSHRESAERLGRPLGSVKTWIRRGLAQLRECLGRQ